MTETRKHYNLNSKQFHLLVLLYKFRFATIPLLTQYKNLKSNSLQRTFDILLEEKYISRNFDPTYKIDRKPAIYYLAAKGIATLKGDSRFHPSMLHAFYKNNALSDVFMQHTVSALGVYNVLKCTYGDRFEMFTRQEIAYFDDFPKTKPDLYLRGETEYFVVLAHDVQPFLARKWLVEYIAHFDEEGWESGTYPTLLFVFADDSRARRFLLHADAALENAGIDADELRIGVTTADALFAAPQAPAIWALTGDISTRRQLEAL